MENKILKILTDAVKAFKKGTVFQVMVTAQVAEELLTKEIQGAIVKGDARIPIGEAWLVDANRNRMKTVSLAEAKPDPTKADPQNPQGGAETSSAANPGSASSTDASKGSASADSPAGKPPLKDEKLEAARQSGQLSAEDEEAQRELEAEAAGQGAKQ